MGLAPLRYMPRGTSPPARGLTLFKEKRMDYYFEVTEMGADDIELVIRLGAEKDSRRIVIDLTSREARALALQLMGRGEEPRT